MVSESKLEAAQEIGSIGEKVGGRLPSDFISKELTSLEVMEINNVVESPGPKKLRKREPER